MKKEPNVITAAIIEFFIYVILAILLFMYGLIQKSSSCEDCEAIAGSCEIPVAERCIPAIMYTVSIIIVVSALVGLVKAIVNRKK